MSNRISEADLILNSDGSIYHLNVLPGELAETIILVGDPDRVPEVSKYFDSIEMKKQKREFIAHTGRLGKKRLSVISTGIGIGDIDIVMNEVDALFNVDLETRMPKKTLTRLAFVRLGTTGAVQADIPVDSIMVSKQALSFDGVFKFYKRNSPQSRDDISASLSAHFSDLGMNDNFILADGSDSLIKRFSQNAFLGITFTCAGFYGPQGRKLRAELTQPNLIQKIAAFLHQNERIINLEMETCGIYGFGELLGHDACSISTAVVNRMNNTVTKDPKASVENMIQWALEKLQ